MNALIEKALQAATWLENGDFVRADEIIPLLSELSEQLERLEQIEQAARVLYEDKINTPEDQITLDEDLSLWMNLGAALDGEDDPRVKELKNG